MGVFSLFQLCEEMTPQLSNGMVSGKDFSIFPFYQNPDLLRRFWFQAK
ncbi:MAG: hypothetical protein KDK25_11330 [Leptospiraceae bacterium]|nr:hypothetical protein [Leptospiraceae bacterium]